MLALSSRQNILSRLLAQNQQFHSLDIFCLAPSTIMPTPALPVQPPTGAKLDSRPKQQEMTKAERRELQERQRAAKLAAKASGEASGGKGAAKSAAQSSASTSTPRRGARPAESAPRATPAAPGRSAGGARATGSVTNEPTVASGRAGGGGGGGLRIFSHFGLQKPVSVAKGDIHPAVLRLALQFSQFKITGANARCIATLRAFQTVRGSRLSYFSYHSQDHPKVIQDYVTPPNNTLSRHLMTHLSPQISHLVAARPMSVTMGNAIRQLKLDISGSDIDLPEQDVRKFLLPCAAYMYCTCINENIFCFSCAANPRPRMNCASRLTTT